jgi:hypothetical protein
LAITLKLFERGKTENIWTQDSGESISDVADLTKGRYRFTFKCFGAGLSGVVADYIYEPLLRGLIGTELPLSKKVVLEDVYYDKIENTMVVILDIRQNPIPIAAVVGAIGLIGLGTVVVLTLTKVEKLVDPKNVLGLVVIGSVVVLSLIYMRDIIKIISGSVSSVKV